MAGETPTTPAVKVVNCPSCGSGVCVRAVGHTLAVACNSCGAILDPSRKDAAILIQAARRLEIDPLIPMGRRGKLRGTTWEVIGCLTRSDATGQYAWLEYLLFNPTKKFHWLTVFDGHWNFIVMTQNRPTVSERKASLLGKQYQLFHAGKAVVVDVVGEFYWRVKVGDVVDVADYINPPEILSSETDSRERIWSIGEYLESDEVRRAFNITRPMPIQSGVAPNQPTRRGDPIPMLKIMGLFWSIVFMLQFALLVTSANETVLVHDLSWRRTEPDSLRITPQFELRRDDSNVEIQLNASVSNSWLELAGTLVNDQTGEAADFEQGVEYYSGYDSDGSWSEGSRQNSITLAGIPSGRYHLNLRTQGPATEGPEQVPLRVTVRHDVPNFSSLFVAMALLTLPPFVAWRWARSFEVDRWSTSDFSPYWSENE